MTNKPDIWHDDLIGRERAARLLYRYAIGRYKRGEGRSDEIANIMSLDAPWGAGKTWFMKRLASYLKEQGHAVIEYDAWKNDHLEDPFSSLMVEIDIALVGGDVSAAGKKLWRGVTTNAKKIAVSVAGEVVKHQARKWIGSQTVDLVMSTISGSEVDKDVEDRVSAILDKAVDSHTKSRLELIANQKKSIKDFRKTLAEYIETAKNKPIFVLIDEMDRCRPTFAISLLERIKHIFDVNGLFFVVSTNIDQLGNSVKSIYGESYDGHGYLKRFFDKNFTLACSETRSFIESRVSGSEFERLFSTPPEHTLSDILLAASQEYSLTLREIQRIIDTLDDFSVIWTYSAEIEACCLVPLILAQMRGAMPDNTQEIDRFLLSDSFVGPQKRPSILRFPTREIGPFSAPIMKGVALRDVYFKFRTNMHVDLPQIVKDNSADASGLSDWVYYRYRSEFRKIHGDIINPGGGQISLMNKYGDFLIDSSALFNTK